MTKWVLRNSYLQLSMITNNLHLNYFEGITLSHRSRYQLHRMEHTFLNTNDNQNLTAAHMTLEIDCRALVRKRMVEMFWSKVQDLIYPCPLVFLSIWWVKPFSTDFFSSFLCCTVLPLSKVRGRVGIPLTCLTPPHYLCMCLSQVRILKFSGCRLFMCNIFVFRSFFYIYKAVSFLVWIVLHCQIGAFYSSLCGMDFAHCWRPYGDL